MHEASIALSILDIAEEHCRKAGFSTIQSIAVDIGSASGVLPDALAMAFDIAKTDTIARDASLIISHIPLGGRCAECCRDFTTDDAFVLECPNCGGRDFRFTCGRELEVREIEVD
ncbi:MAG: hydrogenase maturation nickel metallochaperone HypA [Nitrospirota bacterium]|jgi:hydrogenase nickel incorporation protein HypA/HybF